MLYTILSESEAEAIHPFQNKRETIPADTHTLISRLPPIHHHTSSTNHGISVIHQKGIYCAVRVWEGCGLGSLRFGGAGRWANFLFFYFLAGPKTQFCSATEATHLHKPPLVVNGYTIQKQMKIIAKKNKKSYLCERKAPQGGHCCCWQRQVSKYRYRFCASFKAIIFHAFSLNPHRKPFSLKRTPAL